MSVSKQFNKTVQFLSTQGIIGNSGGSVYVAGGLNTQHLNVNSTVTIANLTITNNLFTSSGNNIVSSQWMNVPAGIAYTSANSNVGINTTSPGFNLDVSGGARITNGITVGTLNTVIGASIPNLLTSSISSSSLLSTNITTVNLVSSFTSIGNLTSLTGTFANKVGVNQTVGTILVTSTGSLIGNSNTIGSIFTTGGNVGINTASPQFTLDVNGLVRISNSLINITTSNIIIQDNSTSGTLTYPAQILRPNSTTPNSQIGIILGQSLTPLNCGQINFTYNSSGSLTNTIALQAYGNGTGVYVNQNSVGINTSSPIFSLDVRGIARMTINSTVASVNDMIFMGYQSSNNNIAILDFNYVSLGNTSNSLGLGLYGANNKLVVTGNGFIGINTTSPQFTLDVNGQTRINNGLLSTFNSNTIGNIFTTGGNVGINTTSPQFTLDINGQTRINNGLLSTFNSNTIGNIFTTGGNVGINTTTPQATLDVNGTGKFTNSITQTGGGRDSSFVALATVINQQAGIALDSTFGGGNRYNIYSDYSSKQLQFYNVTTNVSSLNLDSRGSLGVGISNPVYPLHVSGNIYAGPSTFTTPAIGTISTIGLYTRGVFNANISGLPTVSGTTGNAIALRVRGGDDAVIDFGVNGGFGGWLQTTNFGSGYNYNYPLLLNPNGGNVGINTTAPAFSLDVNGISRTIGKNIAQSFRTVTGNFSISTTPQTYNITPITNTTGYIGKITVYIAQIGSGIWGSQGDLIMPSNNNVRGNLSNISTYTFTQGNNIQASLQPFGGSNTGSIVGDSPAYSVQVVVSVCGSASTLYWTLTVFSEMG